MIHGQRPDIKYISRALAITKLQINKKQFKQLCIATNIKPVNAKNNQKLDHKDTIFYKIEDIKIIANSKMYHTILKQARDELRKERHKKQFWTNKMMKLQVAEIDYAEIIRNRFATFDDCTIQLSDSIQCLYIYTLINDDTDKQMLLKNFGKFCIEKKCIKTVFEVKRGYFYVADINGIEVAWIVPHRKSKDLETNFTERLESFATFSYHHLNFTLYKLQTMQIEKQNKKIFENKKIAVETENIHVKTIINLGKGIIVESEEADFVVTEALGKNLIMQKSYVLPQFIFDCFNSEKFLDLQEYLCGKIPPKKISLANYKEFDENEYELEFLSKTKLEYFNDLQKEKEIQKF